MNDIESTPPPQPAAENHSLIRRRNSISTAVEVIPSKLSLLRHNSATSSSTTTTTNSASALSSSSSSSFPSDDFELLSIKPASHSYTSLKDLLPSVAVNSPRPSVSHQAQLGSDICIRNRLVKQAAWAYLQPISTSPDSAGNGFPHLVWPRVAAFFDFVSRQIVRVLTRALDWILRTIQIRSSR
ncbi:uncharacterized protein LOC111403981 [Olea europaea var. sylvestris]|uniref:uncharacterized protein LOC111403981 n=1 Tax=Olea europaea var. sylvestris TaxID=158386 RepID=UPI000C1D3EA1|nr:uncharacterized protein LOC111403981 [Olea europaea var. sylvestris]